MLAVADIYACCTIWSRFTETHLVLGVLYFCGTSATGHCFVLLGTTRLVGGVLFLVSNYVPVFRFAGGGASSLGKQSTVRGGQKSKNHLMPSFLNFQPFGPNGGARAKRLKADEARLNIEE